MPRSETTVLGYILAIFLLLLALGLPTYALRSVLRARRMRRRQEKLATAYERAVFARRHGLPPLWAGAGLLSHRAMHPIEAR